MATKPKPKPTPKAKPKASSATKTTTPVVTPLIPAELTLAQAYQYLARLTYGPTPAAAAELKSMGISNWLDAQLDPSRAEDPWVTSQLALFPTLSMSTRAVIAYPATLKRRNLVMEEVVHATIIRQIWGTSQLVETLAEFFNDYLHVASFNSADLYRARYDQDVIRTNIFKTYPDMVWAATLHPAMMRYLNLDSSSAAHPNENYAREVMELFTVSLTAGYSETDVQSLAKLLTGFRFKDTDAKVTVDPRAHYAGPLNVMSYTDVNAPTTDPAVITARAEKVIRWLALQPDTAKAFARRLIRRYVMDVPDESYVGDLAMVYNATSGSIPAVVKALVLHPMFLKSKPTKIKRPGEHLASTMRALQPTLTRPIVGGGQITGGYFGNSVINSFYLLLNRQGHLPFNWGFPDGYPDKAENWTTFAAQVARWNLAADMVLTRSGANFASVDLSSSVPETALTSNQIVDELSQRFYGRTLTEPSRSNITRAVDIATNAAPTLKKRTTAVQTSAILLLSAPDWNLR
jgi:uncharacterized protein (DUF1800 family)